MYFSPEREFLENSLQFSQHCVNGTVVCPLGVIIFLVTHFQEFDFEICLPEALPRFLKV